MGAVFDHIKGYGEDQLIDRLRYRDYQVRVYETAARLADGRVPLSEARAEPWVGLIHEAVIQRYVAGDYVEEPA
jgi:hypothetical protein